MEDINIQLSDQDENSGEFPQLIKTLVPSPVIKNIFEANVRSCNSQDIIFVKDDRIELHSLSAVSFVLESTLPFHATIRCAVPYRSPRKEGLGQLESISSIFSAPLESPGPAMMDIILCVTDSGELVVVDWDLGHPHDIKCPGFPGLKPGLRVANVLREARPGMDTCSLGRFIKVTEDSKWIVTGAWQDMFTLKHVEGRPCTNNTDKHGQRVLYADGGQEIVCTETRIFYIEGIIWHFEFLLPPDSQGTRFLIYLLDESGQPKIVLYDHAPTGLINIKSIRPIATIPMSPELQCPLHMIPLDSGEMCIIYEKEVLIIDPQGLAAGSHEPFMFRSDMTFIEEGLITSYAKVKSTPSRPAYRSRIFLGSSNGNVCFIDLDLSCERGSLAVPRVYKTNPVSQALHFSRRPDDGDVLIVGGEMSDTVLYLVPDDLSELIQLHTVPNWSPVADCQLVGALIRQDDDDVVSRTVDPLALAFPSEGRDRLYVGAGHRAEGCIKELRTGLRTNVTVEFELEHVHRIWSLTYPHSLPGMENTQGFIVVSMTHNETKFLRWISSTSRSNGNPWSGDLDIDDYTQNLSLSNMISEATLATSLTAYGILQVTPSGVFLAEGVFQRLNPQERIVQASIVDSDVALVVYHESGSWSLLSMAVVESDSEISLSLGCSIQLAREPSAVKLVTFQDRSDKLVTTRFCFVAFRFPRKVVLYQIHENAVPQAMGELALDCDPSTDNADDLRASEIHSIDILDANGVSYLLLGMRHGMVISCRVEKTDTISFSDIQITKFGNSQVGFISAMHTTSDKSHLFLTSDYLWEVRLKNGQLENDEILFDDFRTPRVLSGSMSTRNRELVLLMDGVVRFVDIGTHVGVWPRKIHIGQTPRRLHYDTKMQRMVVVCTNVESDQGRMNNLAIVDILRNESQMISSTSDDETSNIFAPNYKVNCIYEWRFRNYEKVFSLICLGMGDSTTPNSKTLNGRIVIIACRLSTNNKRTVRTKFIRRFQTKHPVYAITKLDESRLVYSWGTTLSIITFEPKSEEDGHRFRLENKETSFQARSPIINITVIGKVLYCSTLKDSLSLVHFNPDRNSFHAVMSDPRPRLSTFHFALPHLVIVADKESELVGLSGNVPTKYKSFKEVFLIHLHSTVSRIRQGILCSPIIGREGGDEKLSIIAVGLNGSVSILKGTRPRTVSILQWIQNFWLELSGIRGLSVLPGSQSQINPWKADKNALNVDGLVYLTDRMFLGTKIPMTAIPESFWQDILLLNNGEEMVDLVFILRRILNNEFGGISL